jgi:anti-sigma regulatory factor (Ser/Thr protein kinase)
VNPCADAQLAVEPSPRAVPAARRALADALVGAGVTSAKADDACLVVTELLANAILHGTPRADGSLGVAWRITADEIVLEVCDGGPAPVDGRAEGVHGESGGRGLLLVRALSRDFELRAAPDGTRACATLAC